MPELVFLFTLGAAASLIGDHSHVATGTTEYLTDAVPFIWSSPIWFPLLVAAATVSLAELRLRMRAPRTSVTARQGLAGVAAVIGIYVITALEHRAPVVPITALICALAVITWCVLGDGPGAVCGLLAAIAGPIVEAVLVGAGIAASRPQTAPGPSPSTHQVITASAQISAVIGTTGALCSSAVMT